MLKLIADLPHQPAARSAAQSVRDMQHRLKWLTAHQKRFIRLGLADGNPRTMQWLKRDLATTRRRLAEYQHQLSSKN